MGKETIFKSKERKSTEEVAEQLRQIADKIQSGKLNLKSEDRETEIEFPPSVKFKIKYQKDEKGKFSFKLKTSWHPDDFKDKNVEIS